MSGSGTGTAALSNLRVLILQVLKAARTSSSEGEAGLTAPTCAESEDTATLSRPPGAAHLLVIWASEYAETNEPIFPGTIPWHPVYPLFAPLMPAALFRRSPPYNLLRYRSRFGQNHHSEQNYDGNTHHGLQYFL